MLKESPTAFGGDYPSTLARDEAHFRKRLRQSPGRFVLGAFDDQQAAEALVGTISAVRETDLKRRHIAGIYGMYVHPRHRRAGLGARLLNEALQRLKVLEGLERIELSVVAGNGPALALYEQAGFVVYGREPDALKVDGANHDELHLSLKL